MKYCENCKKEYPDDAKFCDMCGQPLAVQEEGAPENGSLPAVAVTEAPAGAEVPTKEIAPATEDVATPSGEADLEVERTSSIFAFLFKMRILIDGQEVGRVGSGNKVRLKVAPGIHEIRVKMPFCGGSSRPLSFQVKGGEFKRFRAGKSFGGFSMMTGIWMFKFIFSGGKIWKVEDY